MTNYGNIEEFDINRDVLWEEYIERLEFYFAANDIITAEKKKAVLLSVCGSATYKLIRSLASPSTVTTLNYNAIVEKVKEHLNPMPSLILQRFKFHKCDQKDNESITDYISELKKLAEKCEFGTNLLETLRDRFVCGVKDEALQRRLLAEVELTFDSAKKKALAAEAAQQHATEIRAGNSAVSVVDIYKLKAKGGNYEKSSFKQCYRCAGEHEPEKCRLLKEECFFCNKKGHIARMCRKKKAEKKRLFESHKITTENSGISIENNGDEDIGQEYVLNWINSTLDPFCVKVKVNVIDLQMEVDTGSPFSIFSSRTFEKLWPTKKPKLDKCHIKMKSYTQQSLIIKGQIDVQVKFKDKTEILPVIIVEGQGTNLLGRSWFKNLGIGINGINKLCQQNTDVDQLIMKYPEVFTEKLGKYKGKPIKIVMKESAKPIFCKARQVPFALRQQIETELEKLVQQEILEPVTSADWATPIVTVVKKNGKVRICGDYRATINKEVNKDSYPLPTVNEMLAELNGGEEFTVLDLAQAYQQIVVDEETSKLLTLNTIKGLMRVKRLQFGVTVATSIFQRIMDNLLAGLKGVKAYLDDVIITGKDRVEHLCRLEEVLKRMATAGLCINKDKCKFVASKVEYLGFIITKDGIRPTENKIKAIEIAPEPKNKTELQAWLGLINYYDKFMKNRANVFEPLYRLLDKNSSWEWTSTHKKGFEFGKTILQSDKLLAHYDSSKPLLLVCDASEYGLGAVISHVEKNGMELPIAFSSRTMLPTERRYAQIDKEALTIIYGVKKFNQYLAGRSFTIITDHKPLLGILNNEREMPKIISPRMLRWSLLLSNYNYTLQHRPGERIANADGLSRLPLPIKETATISEPYDVFYLRENFDKLLTAEDIAKMTKKDKELSKILEWTLVGWPNLVEEKFKVFSRKQTEITTQSDCLLWGSRVIIPKKSRDHVLKLLHVNHPGIVLMKALARSYVWWPGIDAEIETTVKQCDVCQTVRNNPQKAPVHHWEWPRKPWSRLHIDFAGPVKGQIFFIVVDAMSKWLEIIPMKTMITSGVIMELRQLFASHGLPDTPTSSSQTMQHISLHKSFKIFSRVME